MNCQVCCLLIFLGHPKILLVKISFDGNNKTNPKCDMDDNDFRRIAREAHIQNESSIDIFYNKHFEFHKCDANMEAADQLKLFCSLEKKIENAESKFMGVFNKIKNFINGKQ